MATKKYVSLNRLSTFLDNLTNKFAPLTHKHSIKDITGYVVDSQLSSASTNPVQNKVLNAEFEEISKALQVYDTVLDDKANISHSHNDTYYTKSEVDTKFSNKADKSHTHSIANVDGLESALSGKAASSHGTHVTFSVTVPVMDGTAAVGTATTVARSDHKHPIDTSRASKTEFDTHISNTTSHISSTERSNWNTAYNHSQASHAPANAQANQNAFSNVKVGTTTIAADTTTDTLTLVAGANITLTPDANSDSVTISSTSPTYSLSSFNITATAAELNKLDGVTATTTELNYLSGVTKNIQEQLDGKAASSHTHSISNVTNLQTSLDAKQATITGAATTITGSNLTANRALISNGSGKVAISDITSTELGYLDGVTKNIQEQLDGKSSTSHTHNFAGSSSSGGSASSAVKLDTSTAGDSNTPVYFSGGKPVACTSLDLNTSGSSASCTGNSATATKLQTARTINLGTGVTGTATSFDGTGNIVIPVTGIKESYLTWGGRNLSGSVSPIDAACSNLHSANRFAFAKAAGITIEYSTNGSTYSAYSTTDSAKINLVSGNGNTYYIGARSTSTTVNDKLRITLNATNMGVYTRLQKLLINISTAYSTGSNVIIEKAMKGSETTFSTVGTYQISGWSGWNSIPIEAAFGGGSNQTGNIAVLRLTFGITGVNAEQTSNALSVSDIIGIGDTYWSYPSTMAKTGHIYTYDSSQNTTFPANVTATTFVGALSGNATTATTATKLGSSTVGGATQPVYIDNGTATACTYTLGKSVPSNAVFTDTDTKVTNTLATTTKAYVTGTTSASTNTGTQVFDTGVYLDTTAGQLTATTFNGTTFKGSGVATLAEVKSYLGI